MPEGLNPGDKVVALAAAARTAALLAGMVAGGISGWIAKHNLLITSAFIFGGAITGWIVGTIVGKILFPAQSGKVMIVKAGPGSIHMTLKGSVIASFITGLIICALGILFVKADVKSIAIPTLCISVAIGIVLALAVSLL